LLRRGGDAGDGANRGGRQPAAHGNAESVQHALAA
jgi:hypothetical protein